MEKRWTLKRGLSLMLAIVLSLSVSVVAFAEETVYTEDFETATTLTSSYGNNSFEGANGVTWSFVESRDVGAYPIEGKGIMLRRESGGSKLTSSSISGGISALSFEMRKAFTGTANRQVEVFINGTSIGTSEIFGNFSGEDASVYTFDVSGMAVAGDFEIEIRNIQEGQIIIDNLSWTSYSGSGSPMVTAVTADPSSSAVDSGTEVALSTSTEDADIYYTVNGGTPDESSIFYTAPLTITSDSIIKVVAYKDGYTPSSVQTYTYTLIEDSSIGEVRTILSGLGEDESNDKVYRVQGVVSAVLGSGKNIFIQDETGGVVVRTTASVIDIVAVGDKIEATGEATNFNYLGELIQDSTSTLSISSHNNTLSAEPITLDMTLEPYEGMLVSAEGLEVTSVGTGTSYNVYAEDEENNSITIRVENSLVDTSVFTVGSFYNVTGALGQYSTGSASDDGYQILVRGNADVEEIVVPDETAPVIEHTSVVDANIALDLTISAEITDNRNVSSAVLYYRTTGASAYIEATMSGNESTYSAVIPKSALSTDGLEYYIEAADGTNTARMPETADTYYTVAVSDADILGPTITSVEPADGARLAVTTDKTGFRAEFEDESGIDTDSVSLTVNGVDVTASSTVKIDSVSYLPDNALAAGSYEVIVELADTLGNETSHTWSFRVGDDTYQIYFGQLHSHTTLSDGQGSVEEAYAWARDNSDADFFAVTDHSNWFDNDDDWTLSTDWKTLNDTADAYNDDDNFVAIAGYEMTWSGSTGGWGHINTFNTEWFESRTNSAMDLVAYYAKLSEYSDSISQLNHPGTTFGDFADFGYYTEAADAVVHLVEVGNGEGPIRGSGYFPSYEYYTRALDKGWHVGPSNNQDNHKANWVTANEARTVVLAESLTRDGIYDGIRNLRTYATEDSNLEIVYKVNDEIMGTTLVDPESLDFEITVDDPDDEAIGTISIIVDGGITVTEQTFSESSVDWTFTLPAQYTYYYVRIDQADSDIAVTAPVWTGEVVPVGISDVDVSQDPVIVNTEIEMTATLYNNGSSNLASADVVFYHTSISDANKIGEQSVSNIGASSSAEATIAWTPTIAGDYKLIAVMTAMVDGVETQFVESTELLVGEVGELTKVLIDASHDNQYVSGDYAGKMETLKTVAKDNQYMLVENEATITDAVLSDVTLLILTDPQSTDSGTLTKSVYTDEEVAAIKAYIEGGGHLIITSRADYKDASGEYGSAAQGNKLLEAIGSNVLFNDDEVVDDTLNGGQSYRLYFTNYLSDKYGITENVVDGDTYSFYSGCSVILKDGGSDANVDWIVGGHETTYTIDSDYQNDNVPVSMGDVKAISAETLDSGAKVVVAGSTFFSDFETASSDNAYSNLDITKAILNWMIPEKEAPLATIAEVRADANEDGIPDNLGEKYRIQGIVTAQSEAVTPKNAFFEVIYVQDETGGITVFGVSSTELPLGTRVEITGTVGQYENDSQLAISNELDDVVILDSTLNPVSPKKVTTGASMLESNEGWLVQIQGEVTRIDTEGDNAIYLDDGSGEARVYLNGYIGDGSGDQDGLGEWDSRIVVGSTVKAVGLASEDMVGHRLRVRNTNEIQYVQSSNHSSGSSSSDSDSGNNDSSEDQVTHNPTPEDIEEAGKNGRLVMEMKMGDASRAESQIDGGDFSELIQSGAEITMAVEGVRYTFPANEIDPLQLTEGSEVHVRISQPSEETLAAIEAYRAANPNAVIMESMNFEISIVNGDQEIQVKHFGGYVKRIFEIEDYNTERQFIGVVFNEDGITFEPVPTRIFEEDGKWYAELGSLTNSTYAVIGLTSTVDSVETHWSKTAVNRFAAQGILLDVETFSPDTAVTRGTFVTMLTRAMGIYRAENSSYPFADPSSDTSVNQAVAVATAYDLIGGYPDGTFKADARITRQEVAVILGNALAYIDIQSGATNPLDTFSDVEDIADWAKPALARAVETGIYNGSNGKLNPSQNMTNAEAVAAIYNMLVKASLMD